MGKKGRVCTALGWALFLAAAGVIAYLGFTATLNMDDYFYLTFWMDGPAGFVRRMADHYQTYNGRTLVHVVVASILALGGVSFSVAATGLTLLIPYLSLRLLDDGASKGVFLPSATLFIGLLLTLPTAYFVKAYLWISAFFNYVLPTALLLGQMILLRRVAAGERPIPRGVRAAAALLCLLAGASTEQMGLVAVAVCGYYLLWALLPGRERPVPGILWACLLLACGGVASIFLSPATRNRTRLEGRDLWGNFSAGLPDAGKLLFGNAAIPILLGIFFLSIALFLGLRRKRRIAGAVWGGAAVLFPFLSLLPKEGYAWALGGLLAALAALTLQLFLSPEDKPLGGVCFAALLSWGAILFTDSIAQRTLLPGLLFLLAAAGTILCRLLSRRSVLSLLLCLCALTGGLLCRGPEFPGYYYNYQVEQENWRYLEELPETHVLNYNVDYLPQLCYHKVNHSFYCQSNYQIYAHFDPAVDTFRFLSKSGDVTLENHYIVFLNGQRQVMPASIQDGVLYLHTRLLEGFGGRVIWTSKATRLELDSIECLLSSDNVLTYVDADGVTQSIPLPRPHVQGNSIYLPAWVYEELYHISIHLDHQAKTVTLTR